MGADLIGSFLIIPEEGWREILKEHIGRLKQVIGDVDKTSEHSVEQCLGGLCDLGVYFPYYEARYGSSLEQLEAIAQDVEDASTLECFDRFRDLAWTNFKAGSGINIRVMFAGEMSWGDDPQGAGYEELSRLNNIGFFEEAIKSIQWNVDSTKAQEKAARSDRILSVLFEELRKAKLLESIPEGLRWLIEDYLNIKPVGRPNLTVVENKEPE